MGEHKRKTMPAAPAEAWPPAVRWGAAPRWDGLFVTGDTALAWFYGDLLAPWLSARGFHLDVCKTYERLELGGYQRNFGTRPRTTPGAPVLMDWVCAESHRESARAAQRLGMRLLISCDDDTWHLPPWWWNPTSPQRLSACEAWLREADAVIVPSAGLAERVRPFAREIVILPPTLPRREDWLVPRARPREAGLRIGWVGTAMHLADLEAIGPAMLELLTRWPAVTFVLGGECVPSWATDHPRVEIHDGWWLLPGYYRFIASLALDAFVCPLEATPFNLAKPCLKPLEAAMLGLPVIASRVGAYAEDLRHEETGQLLVENTTKAWLDALTRVVEDAALRAHLSARGPAWAASRTIDSTGPLWARVWGADVAAPAQTSEALSPA